MSRIGVIGAGAFGTALGCSLTRAGHEVLLWGRDVGQIDRMRANGRNEKYLPGLDLPTALRPTADLRDLSGVSTVLMVIPSQSLRGFLQQQDLTFLNCPIVLCAKGIERGTGLLQSQVLTEHLPGATLAVISGPGFASELAAGKPTALSIACSDAEIGRRMQQALSSNILRLYLTQDVTGVQLGGALKNVYAIACGFVVGADLGESARAALMTRGFSEMSRLAREMGADFSTLVGLSGFGDLALTCTSTQSRNFAFGELLGRTGAFGTSKTVEGVDTARATIALAESKGIDMPIARVVADVLEKSLTLKEALETLMSRPLKPET